MLKDVEAQEKSILRLHRQILVYLLSAFFVLTLGYVLIEYYHFQELKRSQKNMDTLYTHPLTVSNAAKEALGSVYKSQYLLIQIIHAKNNHEAMALLDTLLKTFDISIENMLLIHEYILGEEGKALEREVSGMMIQWHNIGVVISEAVPVGDLQTISESYTRQKPFIKELENGLIALNQYARNKASIMRESSQNQLEKVSQNRTMKLGVFIGLSLVVLVLIVYKVYELLKSSRAITYDLSRANQLIRKSHAILIVWENKPGWPVSYVSSNIEQLGYSQEEVLSPEWVYETIIHPECLPKIEKEVSSYIANGENNYVQIYRIRKKDGSYRWTQDHTQVIRDEAGNVVRFEGVLTDIHELKTLERSLQEKDEMMLIQSRHAAMGEMISMIAHQWRQPLAIISMSANNMLLDIEFDDMNAKQFQEGANGIIAQTQYLSQTIDDFRDFFKPNKEVELCNINDVMTEVLAIIGPSLTNNNILLQRELHAQTALYTFPKELVQVGINFIKNAKEALVEARTNEPCIIIATDEDEHHVYLRVCDNGPGISSEIITRVFEPYFTTKNEKEGTGLGLYMCKTIVEKHLLGKIGIKSSETGTCFEVVLPKIRPDKQ